MIYSGNAITVQMLADGIAEFRFNLQNDYLQDLDAALQAIKATPSIQGVWVCVKSLAGLPHHISHQHAQQLFTSFSQLPIPKVATLENSAIGGGLEFLLTCNFRIFSPQATFTLPDLQFGMPPFLGGTVRLPRLVGIQNTIDWLTQPQRISAQTAFKTGLADTIVDIKDLKEAALDTLKLAINNKIAWQHRTKSALSEPQKIALFDYARQKTKQTYPLHQYPVYKYVLDHLQTTNHLSVYEALAQELTLCQKIQELPQTQAMIQNLAYYQQFKQLQQQRKKQQHPIQKVAIFGTHPLVSHIVQQKIYTYIQDKIALTSFYQTTPAQYWDFLQPQTNELNQMDITFDLSSLEFKERKYRLENIERECHRNSLIVVKLKDYKLEKITTHLQHKNNVIGLHHLDKNTIELVKTGLTSESCIATVASFLQRLGQQVFVVKDSTGFFVRRVAKAYVDAYSQLLQQGFLSEEIHQALQNFGWKQMPEDWAMRFELYSTISPCLPQQHITKADIVDCMMVALCNEIMRCAEEHIVDSKAELQVMTTEILGFPPFLGGVSEYVQAIGIAEYIALCDKYSVLGKNYLAPQVLKKDHF